MDLNYQVANLQGPFFPEFQYAYVKDPLSELNNCIRVIIRQQPAFFESMAPCTFQTTYHVFGETAQGFKYLFRCRERNGCYCRCCCSSDTKEFNIEIFQVTSTGLQTNTKQVANAYKPLKCTCCCCNKSMIYVNGGDRPIGKIAFILSCCDPEFQIFEENDFLKYYIKTTCGQVACSRSICAKTSSYVFNINEAGTNNILGNITKIPAQPYELLTNADSYTINFPQQASENDKLLIIILGLIIDYQYFENPKTRRNMNFGYRGK